MSLFSPTSLPCAECATPIAFEAVDSVNGDRRADLREAILDGTFQRHECPQCGTAMRLAPELVYLEVAAGQWILARPVDALSMWPELERAAANIFAASFGETAPPTARAIGRSMRIRVVFGWPALQEKLFCALHGIDDVALELAKIAMLRTQGALPFGDATECRLIGASDETLVLAWLDAATETAVKATELPRGVYQSIAADPEAWAPIRAELTAGPHVDMHRLLVSTT